MAVRTMIEDGEGTVASVPAVKLEVGGELTEADLPSFAALVNLLFGTIQNVIKRINGRLTFGTAVTGHRAGNFDAQWITILTPSGANTTFEVPHGLGRTPVGYFCADQDRAVAIYSVSKGSWDSTVLMLRCSVASATINLVIF